MLCSPDDLLLLVVDDEVPGLLQPHGGAGGAGEVQTPGPGALVPPHRLVHSEGHQVLATCP